MSVVEPGMKVVAVSNDLGVVSRAFVFVSDESSVVSARPRPASVDSPVVVAGNSSFVVVGVVIGLDERGRLSVDSEVVSGELVIVFVDWVVVSVVERVVVFVCRVFVSAN